MNNSMPILIKYLSCGKRSKNYYVPPHSHTHYQWFYVISGGIETTIDNKKYFLEANDSIMIPPGLIRSPKKYKAAPTYICTIFSEGRLNLKPLELQVINLPTELSGTIHTLSKEVNCPSATESFLYQHSLLLSTILGLLNRKDSTTNSISMQYNRSNTISAQLLTFMRNNLHKPLTRKDFANLANLSVSQVSRTFKTQTGKSLNAALVELRIEYAQSLLGTSTLPVTQIGYEVGFNSFSHFTQTFKKTVGISPSNYRNKILNKK
jgi:AraC-like DNA-binding protein